MEDAVMNSKDKQKMVTAARNALVHVLDLESGDRILVVTDEQTAAVGQAFHDAAIGEGCAVDLFLLPGEQRPLSGLPSGMSERLDGKTVVVNAFKGMQEETPFRIQWIKAISATKKIRLGHCPGITEAMMIEGPLNVDYAVMTRTALDLIAAFENACSVRITAPGGTDLVMKIEDRPFRTDVHATVEAGCNLPCGEIYNAPVETGTDGILVVDGSIGDVGNVAAPLSITVSKGRIETIESACGDLVDRVTELTSIDEEASLIGELGIGINPGAKLTGNLLEDEKAFRTAHIAFGNNEEMPGGRNRSATHRDFLIRDPTFEVTFKDGSMRILIERGEFQL